MQKMIFMQNRRFACVFIFLLFSLSGFGQEVFPVQVYTTVYPPYTPEVSSFYTGTQEKMVLTVINTDMTCPLLRVRMRLRIVGTAFSILTPPEIALPEIELPAGQPMRFSLSDLAVYFQKENLRTSGNSSEFYRTNRLPDGFYRFQFEAFDAQTNRPVSNLNVGFAQIWIAAANPPKLNLPQKGEWVAETTIPAILFSWTPMHNNSVYAAYNTEYEFLLSEIVDKTVNPEATFTYAPVLYREQTVQTSFLHTAAQPALIPGNRYAWQVRAVARDGIAPANIFLNNGYSEVFWFDYTADCSPVTQTAALVEKDHIRLTWIETSATFYQLEYRKVGGESWHSENVYAGSRVLAKLEAGGKYEYRIGSRCNENDKYVYSHVQAFEYPQKSGPSPDCGLLPNLLLTNREKLKKLSVGDIVYAGDFPVKITTVSGSESFTGEGNVMIPVLKNMIASVTFSTITVNTDRRLLTGSFETKYDENNNSVWNVDKTMYGGSGVGDIRTGEEKASYTVQYDIDTDQQATVTHKIPKDTNDSIQSGNSSSIVNGENASYVIHFTDTNGKNHNLEVDEMPATITDKSGDTYLVDDKGNITELYKQTQVELDPKTQNILRNDLATVTFEKTSNTKYALDVYREEYKKETLFFEEYKTAEETIISSAKILLPGKTDEILVRLLASKEDFKKEKVRFITGKGKELSSAKFDEKRQGWIITLLGSDAGDGQELFVVYEESKKQLATLGKVRIYSYKPQSLKIRLVPVNEFRIDEQEIRSQLDEIYNPVGISCEVRTEDNFTDMNWDLDGNGKLQVKGSGLFSAYTPEMQTLQANYSHLKGDALEKDALYLFMVDSSDSLNVAGDMPRGKQFGYLFSGANGQTVAHEIGHGFFKLQHISDYHFTANDLQDNLMNMQGGKELTKFQWDAIHKPGVVIRIFEKDEDGMSIISDNKILYNFLERLRLSLQDNRSFNVVKGVNTSEKGGITLQQTSYSFVSATANKNGIYNLKGEEASLFTEKTIYGKEVFCIGYAGKDIKIVLHSSEEREKMLKYLHGKRADVYLLFVSGYDPMDEVVEFLNYNKDKKEYEGAWDKIVGFLNKTPQDTDKKDYWNQNSFSDQMISRLNPKQVMYMAGHDDVGTSNHRSMGGFVGSLMTHNVEVLDKVDGKMVPRKHNFNTTPNIPGFLQRRQNGKERGLEYANEILKTCTRDANGNVRDTLDIVCHSMGFAHALGILDAIKETMNSPALKGLTLGRFYIFAPENACSGEVNLKEWQEVWQYGSDERDREKNPELQDGVAPQCPVNNLEIRRAFIPKEEKNQSFLGSHSIKNYGWVFKLIKTSKGYVTPRN